MRALAGEAHSPSVKWHQAWKAAGFRGRPEVREGAIGAHVHPLTSLTLLPVTALQLTSAPPSAATKTCRWPSSPPSQACGSGLPLGGSLSPARSPCRHPCGHPAGAAPGEQGWKSPGCSTVPSSLEPEEGHIPQFCPPTSCLTPGSLGHQGTP